MVIPETTWGEIDHTESSVPDNIQPELQLVSNKSDIHQLLGESEYISAWAIRVYSENKSNRLYCISKITRRVALMAVVEKSLK